MIGILTFYQCYNYGAYLQAYSLHKYLLHHGFDNELINYRSLKSVKAEQQTTLNQDGKNLISYSRIFIKMIKFRLYHLKLKRTKYYSDGKQLASIHYPKIIIGSDQIWCYTKEWGGLDPVFFSDQLHADAIISYAASMGSDNYDKQHPRIIGRLMQNFKHISVRDTNTLNFARSLNPNQPHLVLDPTLLYDFKDELKEPSIKDYILIYTDGFSPNDEIIKALKKTANENNLKIVSIGKKLDWCDMNIISPSPFRWMGYIKNATFVFTCMYHGLLFSIKHQKNFAMFLEAHRENKCLDFLKRINLTRRIVKGADGFSLVYENPIDYSEINAFLTREREVSHNFLMNSLN